MKCNVIAQIIFMMKYFDRIHPKFITIVVIVVIVVIAVNVIILVI